MLFFLERSFGFNHILEAEKSTVKNKCSEKFIIISKKTKTLENKSLMRQKWDRILCITNIGYAIGYENIKIITSLVIF